MIRMECIEPARNRHRFYTVTPAPTLWGWGVLCEWGRLGEQSRGRRIFGTATESEAVATAAGVVVKKMQRGYRVVGK